MRQSASHTSSSPSKSSSVSAFAESTAAGSLLCPFAPTPAESIQLRQRLRPTRDADPHSGQVPGSLLRSTGTEVGGTRMEGQNGKLSLVGCKPKNRKFSSRLFTQFEHFLHENVRISSSFICLLLSAQVKRRFSQSADRPEADPKTATVLTDHS